MLPGLIAWIMPKTPPSPPQFPIVLSTLCISLQSFKATIHCNWLLFMLGRY